MGMISGAVLQHGGSVTAVVPSAMLRAGGEGDRKTGGYIELQEKGREKVDTVIVHSMHERKVEMASRVRGFIGLPGGFGTFEEVMEVATWTQLGIHSKPVILVNVLGFFDPLRALIKSSVAHGFINARNENLIGFVDCPPGADPVTFDWGAAALNAMDNWCPSGPGLFAWELSLRGGNNLDLS
ncbi:lysine decarboxylase-domain-containing protein [Russula brevipes]|nr:lysine decarboxylase-domain-containing protein [Russula brevipes]